MLVPALVSQQISMVQKLKFHLFCLFYFRPVQFKKIKYSYLPHRWDFSRPFAPLEISMVKCFWSCRPPPQKVPILWWEYAYFLEQF